MGAAFGVSPPASAETAPLEARGFPDIRSYSPRDYGSHNQVWTAKAGPDGVMYFGTNGEVVTFDGITWRQVPVPGAAFMRAMDIDDDGTVWVGGVDELGRLVRNDADELVFESLRPLLPDGISTVGDLRRIHAMPDGVYFQTDAYLLRWVGDKFDVWEMHEPYVTLAVRWDDRLILARRAGWMMPTQPGEWEPFPGEPDPELYALLSEVAPDGKGGWWAAASRHGLLHYDGEKTESVTGPTAEFLNKGRLFGARSLPDGRLLFPTLGQGLLITTPDLEPLVHLTAATGLPSNTVITVSPISDNVVWVGTEQGMARLDLPKGFSRFSTLNGMDNNGANAVIRRDGIAMFATTEGPLTLRAGDSHAANPSFEKAFEIDDKLNQFHLLPGGTMTVGGLQAMWWVDEAEQIHKLHSPSNITSMRVHPRFPDHVFAQHLTGIALWKREGDQWTDHRPIEGIHGEFQSLATDADGNLWFGSPNAGFGRLAYGDIPPGTDLYHSPDPKPVFYDESHGLPPIRNRMVVRRVNGKLLFMTEYGFFKYNAKDDRFEPEDRYGKAFTDGTWQSHRVAASPRGGLWIEARAAAERAQDGFRQIGLSRDGEWTSLSVPNLEFIGRMDAVECEIVNGDEILWLCGGEGVIRINVDEANRAATPTLGATVLHSVTTAAGKGLATSLHAERPLEIPARQNSLRFRFGTPGLAGEIAVEHQSRLIGFVDGNLETNNSGERTFTNLPPGEYTFEARGRSADHRWSDPVVVSFVVLAPWWLTTAAKMGWVLLAILLVYTFVWWRTSRLERLRNELESTVASRTAELAQKAAALERLHKLEHDETLAARLAAETARLELLRYQLNPHFLFNSLNSIRALVYTSPDSAGEMVSKLAEFCRRTLSRGGDEMVTLADELEMARSYLEIEQIRWQSGLQVNYDIAAGTDRCKLPQNLLLPLLENAIKYGGRTSPDILSVRISAQLSKGILTCTVTNSGEWVKPDSNPFTDSTQIGLQNLRQRLQRHYRDAARLTHDTTTAHEVSVTITLPCQPPPDSA
ncbi:MAG: hypothetical protein SynsKO_19620 [Synoicihabitans sp.]